MGEDQIPDPRPQSNEQASERVGASGRSSTQPPPTGFWPKRLRTAAQRFLARDHTAARRSAPEPDFNESEETYRNLFRTLHDGFCILEAIFDTSRRAVDFLVIDANTAFERRVGSRELRGRRVSEAAPDLVASFERLGNVALGLGPAQFERRIAASGRWHEVFAYRAGSPDPGRLALLFKDITDRKQAEAELREREERLRMALEAGRMGTWRYDLTTGAQQWSRGQFEVFGLDPDGEPPTRELFLSLVLPEDRAIVEFGPEDLLPGRGFLDFEFRIRRPDGEVRWVVAHTVIRRGADGQPLEMVGLNWDVTARKQGEVALVESRERLQMLVGELQHRTRNLIAVVRATANTTSRSSRSLDDFMARFNEQLGALARVQSLLSRVQEGRPVAFDELVEAELAAHSAQTGDDGRIVLAGPKGVGLPFRAVQSLAMALHELTTNAVKYGALKQGNGTLSVSWRLQRSGERRAWLHVDWKESGVEMPDPGAGPRGTGQGRDLIERGLPYQFDALTSFAMDPDGVHCVISLPISDDSA